MKNGKYNFNYGWTFRLADAFPLNKALEVTGDADGKLFYEREYREDDWKKVGLPHSFNDNDIFNEEITETFDFDELEEKLQSQLEEEFSTLEFLGR